MDKEIEGMPVTLGQAKFLRHVVAEADGATPARLAELAGCSRPNATQTLARLEKAGLVVRVHNPDDGRSVYVRATQDGRRVLERAIDAMLLFEKRLRLRVGEERARVLWSVLFELV
ncbi:MAG: MarR family transcriptional regulator [Myxococcales bacterium]|nr:MarR family transcriptional regulator [Myxococcales bacterium]